MRMPLFRSALTALLIATLGFTASAAEVTADIDLNSAYLWRGITINDGLVAQPSVDIATPAGIGLNIWGNFDLDDYDGAFEKNEFSEVDLYLSYTLPFCPLGTTLTYAEYLFPHQNDESGALHGSRELIAEAGHDIVGNLAANVLFGYDIDEVEDFYAEVGLSMGQDVVADVLSAELGVVASYVGDDWAILNGGGTEGGFNHWAATLTLAHAPTEAVELSANVGYTDSLDEDVLPEQDVDVFGGASASVTF